MKYHQFFNKEREIKDHLLTDVFGSILGEGLYTSVVNPLPKMITDIIGCKRLETIFQFIYKKPHELVIKGSSTSHKAFIL